MKKFHSNIVNLTPQLYEAGKIKIGKKGQERQAQGGGTYQQPVKLDHFVVTTGARGKDNNFVEDAQIMGSIKKDSDGKIRRIPITLLYDEIDLNFTSRYSSYVKGRLFCSGDGESACRVQKDASGELYQKEVPCICPRQGFGYTGGDKCKITGHLKCIIRGSDRLGGVHGFRTTGFNSVTAILSSLHLIKRITGGPLAGIPLDLVVTPKQATDPTGKAQTIYVVAVEYVGDIQLLKSSAIEILIERAKFGIDVARIEEKALELCAGAALPFGEILDEDDAGEFFPEHQNAVEQMATEAESIPSSPVAQSVKVEILEETLMVGDMATAIASSSAVNVNVPQRNKGAAERSKAATKKVIESTPAEEIILNEPEPAPVEVIAPKV